MATNTGNKARKGAVKKRSQVFNPSTGHYIKRDSESGLFTSVKSDGKPYKGIKIEKNIFKPNPIINLETALKVEQAVISVYNKRNSN